MLQTKDVKRFLHATGIFANTMQNRQLVYLKRIPISNREDTPSIPLGEQGQEIKMLFWRFKILGSLMIAFLKNLETE